LGAAVSGTVIRMSLPSPWSVKGVQPKTREAAKDLARREGLTLGEWLNRLIGDVEEDGGSEPVRSGPSRPDPNDAQAAKPSGAGAPPSYREESPVASYSNPQRDYSREADNSRLTQALEQLTKRLDAAMAPEATLPPPPRQPQYGATDAMPFAAAGIMDRLEATERRAETALGRVDASLSDVRQTQAMLADRLRIMEANDPTSKSLSALRGLETALNRLSEQVFETQTRTQNLDDTVTIIAQRVVGAESLANETNGRLKEAMVDLSARLAGVEQNQDDARLQGHVNHLGERLDGMEDITTQAIESVDRGLGLVSERVAATEALAQATNERLVEALIDLSARLVQLESIDTKEQARDLLSAIEAKNKELTRRLETLDQKIDTTRNELTEEVKSAVATGVDGRMAEIAKALADRLDMSERRSAEALEKIGAEMARASISLDQRLREIEDRSAVDIAGAMRSEMARMGRAIDERMNAMERRDQETAQQADAQMRGLAKSLEDRLDASEARAQSSVQGVSSQMEQLALRLQARQDETAQNIVARIEEGEARGRQDLATNLEAINSEIRAAEDRAKAVSAPLHRDFNQLVDRLDQVEATGIAPYAETIAFGGEAMDLEIPSQPASDPLYVPSETYDLPDHLGGASGASDADTKRRPGFGSPFPGAQAPAPSEAGFQDEFAETGFDQAPALTGSEFSEFDEGPFLGSDLGKSAAGSDHNAFIDDFDDSWQDAGRTPRSQTDYLANARLSANRAAAERVQPQAKKRKPMLGANKKSDPTITTITDASGQTVKAKPVLSPVGMVAAAALVVTTGVLAVNHFTKDAGKDEKPSSLNVAPAPKTTAPAAPQVAPAATPEVGPAAQIPAAGTATTTPPAATVAPAVVPPKASSATPTLPPAANLQVTPAPTKVAAAPAAAKPRSTEVSTRQAQAFQASENQRAQDAAARAQSAQARLTPTPSQREAAPVARPNPVAVPVPFPTASTARPNPAQVAPPAPVQMASLTPPRAQPSQATRAAVAVAPAPRPQAPTPQIASAQTPRPTTAAPTAPRASAATRTPTPRIASAPQANIGPVTAANVRQVFDQALAKQRAGDLAGAAALMRAAADTGDARSLQRLAKMYERGEGVARDQAQARALTERAAARGNSQAMHNLGVYYAEGEGAQRDFAKAAASFRQAASRGVTDSQFNLGAMAEQGLNGPRSDREAYYWYSVAGRSGDRDAVSKARELGARLPAAERTAEDQRVAQFRATPSNDD
jgi:localization factor PodJL